MQGQESMLCHNCARGSQRDGNQTNILTIPKDSNLENVTMNKNQDKLDITIDSSCNWCFSDPDGVFGKSFDVT